MKKSSIKYIVTFISVIAFRLIPFRAPNLEPVMATIMPIGKIYGGTMAFIFGASSIILFDSVTSGLGIWTLVTALCYGFLGVGSVYFFRKYTGRKSYVMYAIVSTIVYDAITGLTIGPLFFHQSFISSVVGQIPFTLIHLLGNVSFAIVLSPVIESWMMKEVARESSIPKVVLVS